MERYDLIVIGGGAAGLNVAGVAAQIGIRVLLISKTESKLGGECTHVGCVPSKALLHVAKLTAHTDEAKKFGVRVTGKPEWKKVTSYIQSTIKSFEKKENAQALQGLGIHTVFGQAQFYDKQSVIVSGKLYTARKIVIATGSQPRIPFIDGLRNIKYHTNETIFSLKKIPDKLVIIGGGAIGVEMAYAFSLLGSKVTIVNQDKRLLVREPGAAALLIHRTLRDAGVTILNGAAASQIDKLKKIHVVHEGKQLTIPFDEILIATGRVVYLENLGIEKAGIELDDVNNLKLDRYLRTTNKRVYACGDVTGQLFFTHAAEHHARIITHNLFNPIKKSCSYKNISRVVYTDPELASFGLSEDELKQKKITYTKQVINMHDVDRAQTDNYPPGIHILYISKRGKILGGTIVAPGAGEIIQELVLAKQKGISILTFLNKTYAYPTASRMNQWSMIQYFLAQIPEWVKRLGRLLFKVF